MKQLCYAAQFDAVRLRTERETREVLMAYRVFMSYSTKDMQRVEEVRTALQDMLVEVFVAEHSVEPGQHLLKQIAKAIKACQVFLLVWSENSQESQWVSNEVTLAISEGKFIIPIVLDPEATLPSVLADRKYLPAYRDPQQALKWLRTTILKRARERRDLDLAVTFGVVALAALILSGEK